MMSHQHYDGEAKNTIMLSDWIGQKAAHGGELYYSINNYSSLRQTTTQTQTSAIVCSDAYLMPALQLAYSLTDQICKMEETGKSPNLRSDWVNNIIVHCTDRKWCNSSHDNARLRSDSVDSLGFPTTYCDNDALHLNTADGLGDFEFETINNNPDSGIQSDSNHHYLNLDVKGESVQYNNDSNENYCERAEISPILFIDSNDNNNLSKSNDTQHINRLGEVFYVIFSGGERPERAPRYTEAMEKKIPAKSDTETEELSQELSEDLDPLPFDQTLPIDLAGELSILDDINDDINEDFLFNELKEDDGENTEDGIRHNNSNKKRAHLNDDAHAKYSVSVESLRDKGLPTPLCDLVMNMMDCMNGALSREDTYQSMSDVRSDLRLMLDQPNTFLRNPDLRELSKVGLQFLDGTMFGRNVELSAIKDAYRQSISGKCGLVTISGQSGTGKSLLAHEFGKFVFAEGGIFLSGKFDQLQQGKPFSALASSFDHYCGTLLQNEHLAPTREEMARQLKSSLGMETYHLSKIIPNLAIILGTRMSVLDHDDDCINAQKRVQYLLCRFVEIISTTSSVPITLFLDDLQWADAASIAAMSQLLLGREHSARKNFFFLGCVREKDSGTKWVPGVESLTAGGNNIQLDCMDEYTLNTMISQTLRLSPRLTRPLSNIIYLKTKGNPFFVSRLLSSLSKERLLYLSLSRRRWEWDMEKIRSRKLPDDVAIFLSDSLRKLPDAVQSALFVLSCFGASSESAFVEGQGLDTSVLENLDIAVAEGLVDKVDDQYRFTHDRIQEAAYSKVPAQKRCLIHFQYGLELSSLLTENDNDSITKSFLFTAVNQLNLGGPAAAAATESKEERIRQNLTVAKLNLRAGKKAMEMSDYETAYSYFDNGMSFLRRKHWEEHYTLSLELHTLAAKCALTNGNHTSLDILVKEVTTKAHFLVDKLEVLYCEMCSLASSLRLAESIEKGQSILSKLGIDVRGTSIDACLKDTKDLLSRYTDERILNSIQMTDRAMIMAMKFLGKLEVGMTQIMPKSVPHVTFKIIQLSLAYGLSPISPIGFAFYGSYIAMKGNIDEGYHYVKLALSLLDKVGSRDSAGVIFCICTHVRTYVEPLQATTEFFNEGYLASLASGDCNLAVGNLFGHFLTSLFAGATLSGVIELIAGTLKFSKERKQLIFMVQAQQVQRSVFMLTGTAEEPLYSSEGRDILASNSSVLRSCHYQKAYSSFIFRSYLDMKESIEKYFDIQEASWANLLVAHSIHAFHTGLMSYWIFRKSKEERWHQRGIHSKLALRRWAETSQWTFENKWFLLEAENAFCNNDVDTAKTYYEKAIESAKNHKFVHEEALACELAAYFYMEQGERERTVKYLTLAHEKYLEWGALGKCNSLIKFVECMGKLW